MAGCPASSSVDGEVVWTLRHFGIKIVHQHSQGGFLVASLTGSLSPAWRPECGRSLYRDLRLPLCCELIEISLLDGQRNRFDIV